MEGRTIESEIVPEGVLEAVQKTLQNIEDLTPTFLECLSLFTPEVLAEIPSLQRAECFLVLARATSALFTLKLRCNGIDPDYHPVKLEIERLTLYQEKLERFINLSKAPLRPSTSLNYRAAGRFIKHSLPDLTQEQKQGLKDISGGKGTRIRYIDSSHKKKRKHQTASERKSSNLTAAKEFLEKASLELLGNAASEFRGPLQPQSLDNQELSMS